MSDQSELLRAIHALSSSVQSSVQQGHTVATKIGVIESKMQGFEKLVDTVNKLENRLIGVVGENGDNGAVSEIKTKLVEVHAEAKGNSEKISKLEMTKAWFAGYLAAAGAGGGVVGVLAQYFQNK